MDIDLDVDDGWPGTPDWQMLAGRVAAAAGGVAPVLANPRLCVSIVLTSDDQVHALNREWRGKDKPTNVLSFPMQERNALLALAEEGPPVLLGDITLALETCRREAAEKGVALDHHTAHLMVHGLLHLAGHDHELSEADANEMEALETKALALIGVADPYAQDARQHGD